MEYHIASIDYLRFCRKTELYLELSTINHVFIPEEYTEYDNSDPEEMEDKNIPEFIPVTLCNYRPNGFLVYDANDFDSDDVEISFDEFKKGFWRDSKKRDCPTCKKKLQKLLKKENTLESKRIKAKSIDLRNNSILKDLGNGYSQIIPIDRSKTF